MISHAKVKLFFRKTFYKHLFWFQMAFLFFLFIFLAWKQVFDLMDVIYLGIGMTIVSVMFLGGWKYFLKK